MCREAIGVKRRGCKTVSSVKVIKETRRVYGDSSDAA